MLAKDERRPACGAALLSVGVGEQRTLLRQPIDVWSVIAHDAEAVGTDVVAADIIAPDNKDVGLAVRSLSWSNHIKQYRHHGEENRAAALQPACSLWLAPPCVFHYSPSAVADIA